MTPAAPTSPRRSRSPGRAVLALATLLAALAGCIISPLDPSLGAGIITYDGADRYGITVSGGTTTASAPASNTGGNLRVAFWRQADPASANQQSCATFHAPDLENQPGIALRINTTGSATRAITVTKNIVFGLHGTFNVHVMDTAASPQFTQIGQFALWDTFGAPGGGWRPYPWRMCARVSNNQLDFIVWPTSQPQPAWGDPAYGGRVTVPSNFLGPGRPGFYVGHLQPGASLGYTSLSTQPL